MLPLSKLANLHKQPRALASFLVILIVVIALTQLYRIEISISIANDDIVAIPHNSLNSVATQAIKDEAAEETTKSERPKFRAQPANLPLDLQFENDGYGDVDEDLGDSFFQPLEDQPKPDLRKGVLQGDKRYHPLSKAILTQKYDSFPMTFFENRLINQRLQKCNEIAYVSGKTLTVTKAKTLGWNLDEFILSFNASRPSYWKDLLAKVPQEWEDESYQKKWFRFGGSSVWLAEYGVHLMTSRISYSPLGNKVKPLVSFVHAQVFDSKWNELQGIVLNVPSGAGDDGQVVYREMTFPTILPIDFWYHNEVKQKKRLYFGPEDPRIFLVKDKLGFEEPLVIFNMPIRVGKDNSPNSQYRVMHGYFPFSDKLIQFQFPDGHVLRRQKNWTPIIQEDDGFYHKTLNFVYRYDDLTILQCDLGTGVCSYRYKLDPVIKPDADIGDLRGGTPFIPLPAHESFKLPKNKKIWVSFARAHLMKCGCGDAMYRPNLVILQEIGGTVYKLSHVSGFVGLNVDVTGWVDPRRHCRGNSVFIPNGVSYWEIDGNKEKERKEKEKKEKGKKPENKEVEFDDYLGLTFSVADTKNQVLHIKGLLKYLVSLPGLLDEPDGNTAKSWTDNVLCAIEESKNFCREYGKHN